jgi:Poxvirus A32 protein
MDVSVRDVQFKHPFTAIVAGPTGSGKTVLLRRILKHHKALFYISNNHEKNLRVLWAYGQWQSLYLHELENTSINYIDGLPSESEIKEQKPTVIVVDDLMGEVGGDKKLTNLFTKGSHHLGISVVFIVQNFFHQATQMRTISLNTQYLILLKNPRDKSQVATLARQLHPGNAKYMQEAYDDATQIPYGYLLVDLKPDTPDKLQLRTKITPEELPEHIWKAIKGLNIPCPTIYVPK